MSINVYHKVLLKLYEASEANAKRAVDLVSIVKKEGFGGAVEDIFEHMSNEGWIALARGEGWVYITNWGIEEVRLIEELAGDDDVESFQTAAREARKASESARELSEMLEGFANKVEKPHQRDQARKLYLSALDKLNALKAAFTLLDVWKH